MKTFPSGEPLSGWHWVCACKWSVHTSDIEEWAGMTEGERVMALQQAVAVHRSDHTKQLTEMLDASSV